MRVYRQTVKKNGKIITVKKWYGDVYLSGGRRIHLPLFESQKVSKDFAAKLETLLGQYESGNSYDKNVELWLSQLPAAFLQRFIGWGINGTGSG